MNQNITLRGKIISIDLSSEIVGNKAKGRI